VHTDGAPLSLCMFICLGFQTLAGCSSRCQLGYLYNTLPADRPVDLIIVDIISNDNAGHRHVGDGKPEAFIVQHAKGNHTLQDMQSATTEVIVRRSLSLSSRPAVIYLETFVDHAPEKHWWSGQDEHRLITEPYGVHMVSYRDAVWPVFENRSREVPFVFWDAFDGTHPSWR
jgi:hypothetical protein